MIGMKIDIVNGVWKLENKMKYDIIIRLKPEGNKRKYQDLTIIPKGQYVIYENEIQWDKVDIIFSK